MKLIYILPILAYIQYNLKHSETGIDTCIDMYSLELVWLIRASAINHIDATLLK